MATEEKTYGAGRVPEDTSHCIRTVSRQWGHYQCTRQRGKGPDGMYCTQHADAIAKRVEDAVKWRKEYEDRERLGRLLGHDERLHYVIREQAKELYNAAFPHGNQKGYPTPPDEDMWISDHINSYVDESKKVRKKR